jgi:hypothetical protein
LSSHLLSKTIKNRLYRTIILPVILYGCKTWSLTLRVLRKSGARKDEVTGDCRKLHNEELHNLHSSPSRIRMDKSRRARSARHVERTGEKRYAHRLLVVDAEGKK